MGGVHLQLLFSLLPTFAGSRPFVDTVLEQCAGSRTSAEFVVCLNQTFPDDSHLRQDNIFENIQELSCKGKCGTQTMACSCRPMCVSVGTCCDDFLQECPDEVQRLNGDLQWLRHLKMTCTPYFVYLVTSCPVPGSTLDKLLKAASISRARKHTGESDTSSESNAKMFETTTHSGTFGNPTGESLWNGTHNLSGHGHGGGSGDCNSTGFNITAGSGGDCIKTYKNNSKDGCDCVNINNTMGSCGCSNSDGTVGSTGSDTSESSIRLTTVKPKKPSSSAKRKKPKGNSWTVGRTRDIQIAEPLQGNKGVDFDETPPSEDDEFYTKISVDFKKTYANAPVTDVITGLVFANSSVFDCYNAVTGDKIYWDYEIDPIGEELLNLSMTELLNQFENYIRQVRYNFFAPLETKALHERCIYGIIDKCPEKDSVLGPECARSTGYIKNIEIEDWKFYRNPFCGACNNKNLAMMVYVDPLLWGGIKELKEFSITMLPEWNKVRFVASFKPKRYHFLSPLWSVLTCEEADATQNTSRGSDVIRPNASQTCRIESCRAGVLKQRQCYVETIFSVHLPGESHAGDFGDIPKCLMKFSKEIIEVFVSVVPVYNASAPPSSQIKIYVSGFQEFTLDTNLREFILNIVWARVGHSGVSPATFCVLSGGKHVTIRRPNIKLCLKDRMLRFKDPCTAGCRATASLIRVMVTVLGFYLL